MTNVEIIKMLVNAMDTNGVQDEALKDEIGTTSQTVRNHLKKEATS